MIRSTHVERTTITGILLLLLGTIASGEDMPTLHNVRVTIAHTEADPTDATKRRIDVFDECFRTARYPTEQRFGEMPDDILSGSPEVELVVAGSFRKDEDALLVVTVYWRPDGRRTISGPGDAIADIRQLANETVRFIESADFQDKLRTFRRTRTRDAHDEKLELATELFEQGKYTEVAGEVRSILNAFPDDREVQFRCHFLLGHCLKAERSLEQAKKEFEAADKLSDGDDSALLERGNVAFLQQRYNDALLKYREVISRASVNAMKARWNSVLVLQTQGDLEGAKAELDLLPPDSIHTLTRGQLEQVVSASLRAREEHVRMDAQSRAFRDSFFTVMWRSLVGAAAVVVIVMIAVMYRRAQRNLELTAAQRLDLTGKLMGGLFSVLSLLGGTMLGLLIAK